MPIYEYLCERGHTFDALQSMSDDSLTACEVCGASVRKVLHAPAIHFKGSGFYTTDYGKKKKAGVSGGESKKDESKDSSGSDSSSKSSADSRARRWSAASFSFARARQ